MLENKYAIHSENDKELAKRLLEKSKEAFLLSIELMNKPTIKYRSEACSIFLCNAWELMLKSHLIKKYDGKKIFYTDNPNRTISLEQCVKFSFSNSKDPIVQNLNQIIDLRNTNTHFIVEEYELIYGSLIQACVNNYSNLLFTLHQERTSDFLPDNFLLISAPRQEFNEEEIRVKYPPETVEKIINRNNSINSFYEKNTEGNAKYSQSLNTNFYITKKKSQADISVSIDGSSNSKIQKISQVVHPRNKFPYTHNKAIDAINNKLVKGGVSLVYKGRHGSRFNSYHWKLIIKFHGMKNNQEFSYDESRSSENSRYYYSQKAVDCAVEMVTQEPNLDTLIGRLKEQIGNP